MCKSIVISKRKIHISVFNTSDELNSIRMYSIKLIVFAVCSIAFGQARFLEPGASSVDVVDLPVQVNHSLYLPIQQSIGGQDNFESMPEFGVDREQIGGF